MLTKEELERRLALDYTKSEAQVREELLRYFSEVTDSQMRHWEASGALECREVDGERRYFRNAARNLLRIDAEGKRLLLATEGEERAARAQMLARYIPALMHGKEPLERDYEVYYQIEVKADAVPPGEIVRCWLPFAREDVERQMAVRLLHTSEKSYQIAPIDAVHRSIYMERLAVKGESTRFEIAIAFSSKAEYHSVVPDAVHTLVSGGMEETLCEQLPHICFTEPLQQVAQRFMKESDSAYMRALSIFRWVRAHIPWASAREYSTIPCIPEYVLHEGHGDCGQVALLFITLCRMVGVPARWQSGFMLHPGFENLHDWAEIYLKGLGWVPVDVSFGPQKRLSETEGRDFYFGGMDAFRWIVNSGFSGELFPNKQFERSETVDFQRGEVEWKGGNLYFDSWDYHFEVKALSKNEYINIK